MATATASEWFSQITNRPALVDNTKRPRIVSPLTSNEKDAMNHDRWIIRHGGHASRTISSSSSSASASSSSSVTPQMLQGLIALSKENPNIFRQRYEKIVSEDLLGLARSISRTMEAGTWERNRAGAPYLMRGVLWNTPLIGALSNFLESKCRPYITETLQHHNLPNQEIAFVGRTRYSGSKSCTDLTIVIIVDNDDFRITPDYHLCNPTWFSIVDDIRLYLISMVLSPGTFGLNWTLQEAFTRLSDLKVEIVSRGYYYPTQIEPVLPSDPICLDWRRSLRDEVIFILEHDTFLKGRWNSLSVFRLGLRGQSQKPITIVVTVDPELNEIEWIRARKSVEVTLESYGNPQTKNARVSFERGQITEMAGFRERPKSKPEPDTWEHLTDLEKYPDQINMGADIGTATDFHMPDKSVKNDMGTLGGLITLTASFPQKPKPMTETFGLTNYHVVRGALAGFRYNILPGGTGNTSDNPVPGSALERADKVGFFWNSKGDNRVIRPFESPSRCKHDATTYRHEQEIAVSIQSLTKVKNPQVRKQIQSDIIAQQTRLKAKKEFFNQNRQQLGSVVMGSGYASVTRHNQREDWALVRVPKQKVGENLIPVVSQWRPDPFPQCVGQNICGTASLLRWLDSDPTAGISGPEALYMVSARSGKSKGQLNWLKTELKAQRKNLPPPERVQKQGVLPSRITQEIVIISHGPDNSMNTKRFGDRGDSGGWVFTENAKWVALHWGGQESFDRNAWSEKINYATDAEDVLESIRKMFCANHSNLRGKDIKLKVA